MHGSLTWLFLWCAGAVPGLSRANLKPCFATYGIVVGGCYFIYFLHALMSCGAPNMHRRSSKAFEQHLSSTKHAQA